MCIIEKFLAELHNVARYVQIEAPYKFIPEAFVSDLICIVDRALAFYLATFSSPRRRILALGPVTCDTAGSRSNLRHVSTVTLPHTSH